jgi:hypothetical protein
MQLDKLSIQILEAISKTQNIEENWTTYFNEIGNYSGEEIRSKLDFLHHENFIRVNLDTRSLCDEYQKDYLSLTNWGLDALEKNTIKYKVTKLIGKAITVLIPIIALIVSIYKD